MRNMLILRGINDSNHARRENKILFETSPGQFLIHSNMSTFFAGQVGIQTLLLSFHFVGMMLMCPMRSLNIYVGGTLTHSNLTYVCLMKC